MKRLSILALAAAFCLALNLPAAHAADKKLMMATTTSTQDSGLLDHMMGVVCLVDIYCYTIRIIGQLSNCIYDKSVVAFSVIGGHYIETIADAEKGGHVVFVCKIIIFCNIFLAEFI